MTWANRHKILIKVLERIFEGEGKSFSMRALEKRLGLTQGKTQHWKKGQRPSADDLEAMAREFALSPRWLLLGEGEPEEGGRATVTAPPCTSDPIAQRVDQVACAMRAAGVDEMKILAAARDMLEGEIAKLARERGQYGAAEPTAGMPKAAEEQASYAGNQKAAGKD